MKSAHDLASLCGGGLFQDSPADQSKQIAASEQEDLIEDFLDRLVAPLVGAIPASERLRLKEETRFHIERLQRDFLVLNMPEQEAAARAIEKYGDPEQLAIDFLDIYYESSVKTKLFSRFGRANFTAFAVFGAAQLIYILALQLRVTIPSGSAYGLPVSPADARRLLPEPFPIPGSMIDFLLLYGYPVLAPLVAGWVTGLLVPARVSRAVWHALMPIILYSFIVGALMLPVTTGLLYALVQVFYWLPVGCGVASLSAVQARERRRAREKRIA